MTLYQIITAVQNASGKNAKRDVLRSHADNFDLKVFLKATYDPRLNYYMKKLPPVKNVGPYSLDHVAILQLIGNLVDRVVTGAAAKKWFTNFAEALTQESQALLFMLMDRDIRAGIAHNSVLEVFPGLFFIPPYQRCASMTPELKERFGQMDHFYVQTKSDGQFAYVIKGVKQAPKAMTRTGNLHPQWLADHASIGLPEGYAAMGELLVYRSGVMLSRKEGNGILNSVLEGDGSKFDKETDKVAFVAWDMVTADEFLDGKSERPYKERLQQLRAFTPLNVIAHWTVRTVKEANRIQAEHVARGEEGTVWKSPEMGWRDCSSGDKDMMKAKVVFEADFEIEGAYVHKKNPAMLGGFNMKTSDGLIKFDVGSGFSDRQRFDYWSAIQTNPDAFNGCIAACEGNDIVTSKGKTTESLFLPIFIELRLDKTVADTKEQVWQQFNAVKLAKF